MSQDTHEYSNGEVTVVWKPKLCVHSGICARGLPLVFKPRERPWVNPMAATTDELVAQVMKCPSGALTIKEERAEGRPPQAIDDPLA